MKIGIYPGSFNPFHIGHYDIACKAEKVFDHIIIAQGCNPDKNKFIDGDCYLLPFKYIYYYEHSLIKMIIERKEKFTKNEYSIIRGLRNGYDLHYEETLRKSIEDYIPNIPFVYFFCDRKYEHISSTMIRNLIYFNENVDKYLVERNSKVKFSERKETY